VAFEVNILKTILPFVLAYLLGSIPAAVWIGKGFHKIDIRKHGSGNAGTTNIIRILGWKTGIPVLIIDVIKGWLAAMLPIFFQMAEPGSGLLINMQIIAGLTAVVGHMFPVFADFRGGKGVATVFGVLLALHPILTICCFGVFLVIFLITGIVSLASMGAGIIFPILLFFIFDTPSVVFKIFSIVVAIALLLTHRNNIRRLLRGEESKLIKYGRKKE